MGKFDVSKRFNESALDAWRFFLNKLQRSNSKNCDVLSVNKMSFIAFSIRWLFQVADTLIKVENYSEAEDIYMEVDLICTNKTLDYDCVKQALYSRKENLQFLITHGSSINDSNERLNELQFEDFVKIKQISDKVSTKSSETKKYVMRTSPVEAEKKKSTVTRTAAKQLTKSKNVNAIFVDPDEDSSPTTSISSSQRAKKTEKEEIKKETIKKLPPPPKRRAQVKVAQSVEIISDDSVIVVDSSIDTSPVEPPKPPKKFPKTPAMSKTLKKPAEKSKTKVEQVELIADKPVLRHARRLI